jgi:hypothetical protein
MSNLFVTPQWFYGYDVALELIFAVVTLLVSFFAWKIFKVTGERNIRLFSLAFLFISLSYIIQSMLNFIILEQLEDNISALINLQSVYLLNLFGIYMHAILFLIGILLLAYVALKIHSFQTFVLLFILVFTSLYFTPYNTYMLYLLSTVLLGFIVYYYLANYWASRKPTALMVLISMILLFVAYLHFIFAMDDNMLYYMIGHILELLAYLLVFVTLWIILRLGKQKQKNGKKTR